MATATRSTQPTPAASPIKPALRGWSLPTPPAGRGGGPHPHPPPPPPPPDRFDFAGGSGADTIADFDAAAGDQMQIAANANGNGIVSFAGLAAAMSDDASGNAVVDLGGGNSITLIGIRTASLSETDFLFV